LDEPLSAIDASGRESLALTIRRVQKQTNTTTIYVTHSSEEARLISDRVAIMYDGKVQQIDEYTEIDKKPLNFLVAKIMGSSNVWPLLYKEDSTLGVVLHLPIGKIELKKPQDKKITGVRIREDAITIVPVNEQKSKPNFISGRIRSIIVLDENTLEVIVDVMENLSEYIKAKIQKDNFDETLGTGSEILLKVNTDEVVIF
jgi:ABC-type Fe3+/spermidine/putrescine transport system ATPase subunit